MIVFAWADPEDLREARAHIRRSLGIDDGDHTSKGFGFDGSLRLYAKPEDAPAAVRPRLVRVQVRADYI